MSFLKLCAVCCGDEGKSRASAAAAPPPEPDAAMLISRGFEEFDEKGDYKRSSKISFGLGKVVEYEVESEEEVSEDSTSGSETDEGEDALVPRDWVELQKTLMGKPKKPPKRVPGSGIPANILAPIPSDTTAAEVAIDVNVRESAASSASPRSSTSTEPEGGNNKRSSQRGAVVAGMKKHIQDSVILRLSPRNSPRGGNTTYAGAGTDGTMIQSPTSRNTNSTSPGDGGRQSETVHHRVSTRFIERRRDSLQFAPPPSTGILRRVSAYKEVEAPNPRTPTELASYYGITPNYDYT